MGKRIKLTEAQVDMLKNLEAKRKPKIIKVTKEQYDRLFIPLNENEKLTGHPVAGDGGKEYNPQDEKENEATTKSFNENVSDAVSDSVFNSNFKIAFKNLIKAIIEKPEIPDVPKFFTDKGFSWETLKPHLLGFFNENGSQLKTKEEFLAAAKSELPKLRLSIKNNSHKNGDDIEVDESTTTGSVGGSYVTPKVWAKSPSDMKFGKSPIYKKGVIVKDNLTELEKVSKKRYVAEIDMYLFADSEQEAMVEGNEIARLVNKKFDVSARVSKLKEMAYGTYGEGVERPNQIEFDDCVKFNNNKEAQNGGCSVGAVDGVVKIKESLFVEVATKTGRSISEVKAIIEGNFNK